MIEQIGSSQSSRDQPHFTYNEFSVEYGNAKVQLKIAKWQIYVKEFNFFFLMD